MAAHIYSTVGQGIRAAVAYTFSLTDTTLTLRVWPMRNDMSCPWALWVSWL